MDYSKWIVEHHGRQEVCGATPSAQSSVSYLRSFHSSVYLVVSAPAPPAGLHSIHTTHVHKPLQSFTAVFSDEQVTLYFSFLQLVQLRIEP